MSLSLSLRYSCSIHVSNAYMEADATLRITNLSIFNIQSESIQQALVHFAVYDKGAKQVFVNSKERPSFFSKSLQFVKTQKVTKPFLSPQALSLLVEPGILTQQRTKNKYTSYPLILSNLHLPSAAHYELPTCCVTDKRLHNGEIWRRLGLLTTIAS